MITLTLVPAAGGLWAVLDVATGARTCPMTVLTARRWVAARRAAAARALREDADGCTCDALHRALHSCSCGA